jgi:HPt (histidine-containing phosphotransfer) domain-containing protein
MTVVLSDTALIDQTAIDQLKNAIPSELMDVVIVTFRDDCEKALHDFEIAYAAHAKQDMRKIAHRLKGIFAQFGAQKAAAYAAYLSDHDDVADDVEQPAHIFRQSIEAVVSALQPHSSSDLG